MIKVYSKNTCPFCVKAKQALDSWGIQYEEINVDQDHKARFRLREMGLRTVPQIFISEDEVIPGGCDGLIKLGKQGLTEALNPINTDELGSI